jgi:hypothetical protein
MDNDRPQNLHFLKYQRDVEAPGDHSEDGYEIGTGLNLIQRDRRRRKRIDNKIFI